MLLPFMQGVYRVGEVCSPWKDLELDALAFITNAMAMSVE